MEKVRGWPTDLWGWGLEDFVMHLRFQAFGIEIVEATPQDGQYKCLSTDASVHTARKIIPEYDKTHQKLLKIQTGLQDGASPSQQQAAASVFGNLDSLRYSILSRRCLAMDLALKTYAANSSLVDPVIIGNQRVIHLELDYVDKVLR
jgi:hypothetical protein